MGLTISETLKIDFNNPINSENFPKIKLLPFAPYFT